MARWALGVQYNGAAYSGWQIQQEQTVNTVQGQLERALGRVAAESLRIQCAGRTDAGVHGINQVVHFDTTARRCPRAWTLGGNSYLPSDISIQWAQPMPADFHARFAATARRYQYIIDNNKERPALFAQHVAWCHTPLDESKMLAGARLLLGQHDFTSFRSSKCQAHSPVRTVSALDVRRLGQFILIDITANAFLHHMVRNIVGVLLRVGKGEEAVEWVRAVLLARDRTQAGMTAPAQGLYFCAVTYPDIFALPPITMDAVQLILKRSSLQHELV